jgi:hypothetical protein
LLLSVAALDGVTSATGAEADEASASAEVVLVFFFFEDLESDLICGFWVAEAAIVTKARDLEGESSCGTTKGSWWVDVEGLWDQNGE